MENEKYIKLYRKDGTEISFLNNTPENLIMLHTLYKLQKLNSNKPNYRIDSVR